MDIVIVEGNYLLLDEPHWSEIPSILDYIYFLSVDLDVAKSRLAKRHAQAWDWPIERAMHRVEDSDYHNMVLVDRTKDRASEILPDTV